MELPIDHFRLLGVSPSSDTEEVLRFFQLRLDRTPEEGFTPEVMEQRKLEAESVGKEVDKPAGEAVNKATEKSAEASTEAAAEAAAEEAKIQAQPDLPPFDSEGNVQPQQPKANP